GKTLFAFATNAGAGARHRNVQLSRSTDGRTWTPPADAMPMTPAWAHAADASIWAPEAMRFGDRYVLYFSARHATRRRADGRTLCIGAAVAVRPEGPYVPQPVPLTCGGTHGVIDASPFADGDTRWLYYKTDGNCCGVDTVFMVQQLAADGLSLLGDGSAIAGMAADQPWEGRVIEAPQMHAEAGRYWLFYAANDYGGGDYAIGYAACDGPRGPCRDAAENPLLRGGLRSGHVVGPGHQGLFRHDGGTWIAYHGWRGGGPGRPRYRALYVDRVDWTSGRPVVQPR
ncbi:MAG TPA: glycoside hydrolase family 43 protein, partial [Luteimonas sp.]|nr:glycoside hydrolase family 43 protein [Luteimonas sp.]